MTQPERLEGVNVLEEFYEAELLRFARKRSLKIENLQGWHLGT
jgi:hypothetical protein